MTRNAVLIAINLLIAAAIGVNAASSTWRGCDFAGGCSGSSSAFTWALGIGLPLLVACGLAFALALWLRRRRRHSDAEPTVSVSERLAVAETLERDLDDDVPDAMIDSAMTARLARAVHAAHHVHVAHDEPRIDPPDDIHTTGVNGAGSPSPARVDTGASLAANDLHAARLSQADAPGGWSLAKSPSSNAPNVDPFPALAAAGNAASIGDVRSSVSELEAHAAGQPAIDPLDWLLDPDSLEPGPQLRSASGFPWVVAGIDHSCVEIARLGTVLAGSDFLSEAAAWRQVVAGLDRAKTLSDEDCRAFVSWLNSVLTMAGPQGFEILRDALHELAVEGATSATLAASLPPGIGRDEVGPQSHSALRQLK